MKMLNSIIEFIKKTQLFDLSRQRTTATNTPANGEYEPKGTPVASHSPTLHFVITNHLLLSIWKRVKPFRSIGIICAFTSVVFWSLTGLSFKLNTNVHALTILTISSLVVSLTYLLIIFTLYGTRESNSNQIEPCGWSIVFGIPGERISLLMRCLCGTISLACFYSSYRYIPLGDATTIRFTSPVFIAIFAHFLVNEPFGLLQLVNAFTTLTGVLLIGRPSFIFGTSSQPLNTAKSITEVDNVIFLRDVPNTPMNESNLITDSVNITELFVSQEFVDNNSSMLPFLAYLKFKSNSTDETIPLLYLTPLAISQNVDDLPKSDPFSTASILGVLLSLAAAISISISMIFMRKLKKTPAPLVIFWFSLSNVLVGTIGMAILGEFHLPNEFFSWLLIFLTTLCSGLDQFFITSALKLENAGAVAIIQALCVVISFIFSILILHEPLYWTSALGGTCIFLSVIVLGISKMMQEANYARIKSTIFQINIRQSNSRCFNIDKDSRYTTLSYGGGVNSDSSLFYKQFNEPYLTRIMPICDLCMSINIDLNNNCEHGPNDTRYTNTNIGNEDTYCHNSVILQPKLANSQQINP